MIDQTNLGLCTECLRGSNPHVQYTLIEEYTIYLMCLQITYLPGLFLVNCLQAASHVSNQNFPCSASVWQCLNTVTDMKLIRLPSTFKPFHASPFEIGKFVLRYFVTSSVMHQSIESPERECVCGGEGGVGGGMAGLGPVHPD